MSLYCFPADDVPAGVEVPAKPVTSLRRSAGTELLCGLALSRIRRKSVTLPRSLAKGTAKEHDQEATQLSSPSGAPPESFQTRHSSRSTSLNELWRFSMAPETLLRLRGG